jgi:thiol-disulfide isomerase/thioredoxin
MAVVNVLVVSCLCAEWCDTCVEYRPGFLALATKFPQAEFRWIDIEDQADEVGDLEVENFPTIRVTRAHGENEEVLFHGTQLPIHAHLERLLQELFARQEK